MDTNPPLGLSRRTLLAGLGSVGAIGIAGRVGSGLLGDSRRFPRHTLAATPDADTDLLVTWQQRYSPRDDVRRPVNAHPDDDGDGVQSYAGTAYDVAAGESALRGVPNACRDVPAGAFAVEQDVGEVSFSEALAFEAGQSIEAFYSRALSDHAADGVVRTLFSRDADTDRPYLVFLLGSPPTDASGATVSFDVPGGLPPAGSWAVTDAGGSFGSSSVGFEWDGPTGGAYGPLDPPFSPILLDPDLSGATGAEWQVLSNGSDGPNPIPMDAGTIARLSAHGGIASGDDVPIPGAFRSDVAPGQTALLELSDVMPGDSGEIVFDVSSCNTAEGVYLWLLGTAFEDRPGTTTEPEAELGTDTADLAESVVLDVRYAVNKNGEWTGEEPVVFGPDDGTHTDYGGSDPATLAAAFDLFRDSTVLDALTDDPNVVPLDGDDGTAGRNCLATDDVLSLRVGWKIPTAVGNEIQGDVAGLTLGFYAEQCKNNDKAINGSV